MTLQHPAAPRLQPPRSRGLQLGYSASASPEKVVVFVDGSKRVYNGGFSEETAEFVAVSTPWQHDDSSLRTVPCIDAIPNIQGGSLMRHVYPTGVLAVAANERRP
jgi:hypothetical protein